MPEGRDIFISHVAEDRALAIDIAAGLEQAGHTTWYYERDGQGHDYVELERMALEAARVILLLISDSAVSKSHVNRQVEVEIDYGHKRNLPFIPVLAGLEWAEFERRQPRWAFLMGSAVGLPVPPGGAPDLIPPLLTRLEGVGLKPRGQAGLPHVLQDYPLPLAATYARKMAGAGSQAQAFQAHAGLGDVAQATVKFLAALAVAQYRADTGMPGREDAEVERDMGSLVQPGLAPWVALLHGILSLHEATNFPLLRDLRTFYYGKTHRNNPVSQAAARVQEWLGTPTPRRAPFTYRDLFEILLAYHNWPVGWATQRAVLADYGQYQERVDVLRPALEQALADLEFLTGYPLIYVQEGEGPPYRLHDATGRDVTPAEEPLAPGPAVRPGHLYLCRRASGGLEPLLDLHPLLVCHRQGGSQEREVFFYHPEPSQGLEYLCYASGHGITSGEAARYREDMRAFSSLADWRRHLADQASGGNRQAYVNALREVLRDGEIDALERQKLDFLTKVLGLMPEQAARLEAEIRREMAPAPPPPHEQGFTVVEVSSTALREGPAEGGPAEVEETPAAGPAPEQEEALVEPVQPAAPVPEQEARPAKEPQRHLACCWQQPRAAAVTHVALLGALPLAFTVDETGEVLIQAPDGRVLLRDHIAGRAYRLAALSDRAVAGGWDGGLYCFDRNGLVWHEALKSPVSALAAHGDLVVAGTWDGRLVALAADDGRRRWQSGLADGVSVLSLSSTGERVVAGSYAGHLAVLDAGGGSLWLQTRQSPVVAALFDPKAEEVIVSTRNRLLCIRVENQELVWEQPAADVLLDMSLSGNGRRLAAALKSGQVLLWNVNGSIGVRSEAHRLEGLSRVILPAVSADGPLTLLLSGRMGLYCLDNRSLALSREAEVPAQCMAVSADGRHVLVGSEAGVALFRLARPALRMTLEPAASLVQGRSTRVKAALENGGERPAYDIEIEVEGPARFTRLELARELEAGAGAASEKWSVRPDVDGTLPITLRLRCRDDLGLKHEEEQVHLLDVLPAPADRDSSGAASP